MIDTWYQPISEELISKLKKIKLVLSDVDGVLSDGKIYLTENGDEIKSFNAKDGAGIRSLIMGDIGFGVITGRESAIVNKRMKSLGVNIIFQGAVDKTIAFKKILADEGLSPEECLYIGDDSIDIPLLKLVGVSVAVRDAHPSVKDGVDLVTVNIGGNGAVREVADIVLQSQNKLNIKAVSV